ncbi:MAG: class I SAM-dependent methyltransferase [Clostridiales bacterium]|nr:class I SAM-dependent methyltransferase [Clostridiales bacterium]
MNTIDKDVLAAYNAGVEKGRLHSDLGLIEFARTKEILVQMLPLPPATVYDIGGGYGEYAFWLASLGYDVFLYDISCRNIEVAKELSDAYTNKLKAIELADARSINRPNESADAILLFGPLYHIVDYAERQLALAECYRLLRPGGLLFTAAITRYATTLWAITTYGTKNRLLEEAAFCEMIEHEIKTGQHIKNLASAYRGMGRSFFHLPDELTAELHAAGFTDTDIRGIIGPAWLVPNLDAAWKDERMRESILRVVRLCEKEESILGLSTHLLSISKKPY